MKILPIVSPQFPKKDTIFSPKPLINSQMPRNKFLIPDQILLAKVDGVKSVGKSIKDFLGFGSPTKKGPGHTADEWIPNLMDI